MNRTKSTYLALLAVLLSPMAANADPILGDLTDGSLKIAEVTGEWGLYANSGDVITITMRRLSNFDPLAWIAFGFDAGSCCGIAYGDDNLVANPGYSGGYGDPQFTFTAPNSGRYTIGAAQYFDNLGAFFTYNIQATGSTYNAVPEPGTLALLGLGLVGMAARRRKTV